MHLLWFGWLQGLWYIIPGTGPLFCFVFFIRYIHVVSSCWLASGGCSCWHSDSGLANRCLWQLESYMYLYKVLLPSNHHISHILPIISHAHPAKHQSLQLLDLQTLTMAPKAPPAVVPAVVAPRRKKRKVKPVYDLAFRGSLLAGPNLFPTGVRILSFHFCSAGEC